MRGGAGRGAGFDLASRRARAASAATVLAWLGWRGAVDGVGAGRACGEVVGNHFSGCAGG